MPAPRIRVGNQTNKNTPYRLPYEFALANGFDAFEWFSDRGRGGWDEESMGAAQRAELRRAARDHDVLFSVHAPVAADPVTPEGAEAIRRSVRFAGDVGGGVVNVHLFPGRPARVYVEALRPLLDTAAAAGVRLSLENTPPTPPDHVNAVFGVLSAVPGAAGRVGMCLDTGHANLFPGTRNNYLAFVDQLGDHVPIVHWHAHENWGDGDSHLTLFTGPSASDGRGVEALVKRLIARGFSGSVVLEQWPDPPGQLVEARDRLLSLWGRSGG